MPDTTPTTPTTTPADLVVLVGRYGAARAQAAHEAEHGDSRRLAGELFAQIRAQVDQLTETARIGSGVAPAQDPPELVVSVGADTTIADLAAWAATHDREVQATLQPQTPAASLVRAARQLVDRVEADDLRDVLDAPAAQPAPAQPELAEVDQLRADHATLRAAASDALLWLTYRSPIWWQLAAALDPGQYATAARDRLPRPAAEDQEAGRG